MKLVTCRYQGKLCPAALTSEGAVVLFGHGSSILDLIRSGLGPAALGKIASQGVPVPLNSIEMTAPIPLPPRNLFCVGKNYVAHAREFQRSGFDASSSGQEKPDVPIIFTKPPTTVIGPNQPIPGYLDTTASVDYEGELAVVIGTGGRTIPRSEAMRHVFGYTILNDVTSRTQQYAHKQWFLGKSLDGFCPMGPSLVTADEIPEPAALRIKTHVNGELRQDASVADLIFDVAHLIETISRGITLWPGDIIATGTPEGVGVGFKPPRYLQAGDVVDITIKPIGTLSNPVA
jgi:2-keto-4-pentenoate hydratase/2-oxohepta-3-ene-1,7-dioic acid hydratase in catechol pathway